MTPVEAVHTPIPGKNPAGEDIRFDPLFDQIQNEITVKPSSDPQSGNWPRIVDLSTEILGNRSKDLLVGSYLAVALLHQKGLPDGLQDGLTIMADLMSLFWNELFPPLKRMRGRVQAITWWQEKTVDYLRNSENIPDIPAQTQATLVELVNTLFDLFSEKCPDAPSPRTLLEFVKSLPIESTGQPAEEEPVVAEETAPPSPATAVPKPATANRQTASPPARSQDAGLPIKSVSTQEDVQQLLNSVIANQYLLVDFMIATQPTPTEDPAWYKMNLLAAWFEIKKQPPATDNKTLIPAPDPGMLNSINNMKSAGNLAGVINNACFNIRNYPFWLDMNRYASEAMQSLGSQYKDALLSIASDTVFFIQRFKGVENLTFNDGTPFANQQTREWLRNLSNSDNQQQEHPAVSQDDINSKVTEGYQRCKDMFSNGKQGEALNLMHQLLQESKSARERCLWRAALLRLFLFTGMEKLATPHLNELMKDFDYYHLESWEPEMAISVLRTIWNILRTQDDQESKKRADEILSRISMLSPSEAFNLVR